MRRVNITLGSTAHERNKKLTKKEKITVLVKSSFFCVKNWNRKKNVYIYSLIIKLKKRQKWTNVPTSHPTLYIIGHFLCEKKNTYTHCCTLLKKIYTLAMRMLTLTPFLILSLFSLFSQLHVFLIGKLIDFVHQ